MDCIFCKIIAGEIPSQVVYQDDTCVAIRDINPQTPVHVLVIPRRHVRSLNEAASDPELLGKLMKACATVAQQEEIDADGYRVITNIGVNGAQTVQHLHLHVMGGCKLPERMA